ncbi:MAG: Glu-tRNA(Gln) amidotransferase GatDE subunit D, partial [Gammaproteobacteria bacterium]|nr:Glu-tRNA(Gln) amidotransferase GatDE subunit D [Gammaproteobacteria bacterium]
MENEEFFMLVKNFNKRNPSRKLVLKPRFDEKVALVKFYPGLDPQLIDWYVDEKYRGIVLEGTGLGHVGNYCFSAVKNAIEKGVLVAMTSQCI